MDDGCRHVADAVARLERPEAEVVVGRRPVGPTHAEAVVERAQSVVDVAGEGHVVREEHVVPDPSLIRLRHLALDTRGREPVGSICIGGEHAPADQHPRIAEHVLDDRPEPALVDEDVVVGEHEHALAGERAGLVPRRRDPRQRWPPLVAHDRAGRRAHLRQSSAVGCALVDDDDLARQVVAGEDRLDGVDQQLGAIPRRDDDGGRKRRSGGGAHRRARPAVGRPCRDASRRPRKKKYSSPSV